MITLGIESSCDDTALAIITERKVIAEASASQIDLHRPYGGVVPELAARNHLEVISELLTECLSKAQLKLSDIKLIAATGGPGLIGGVITSTMFAKGLALANNIPVIFVNHLAGHALTARFCSTELSYPFLLLLASGGHCQILSCSGPDNYQLLGKTLDDAIGEAFDKTAKLLDLPYPGGPEIEQLAKAGNEQAFKFPIALKGQKNCDFSLSGLKTAVRTTLEKNSEINKADIAASFQYAVAAQIIDRLKFATKQFKTTYPNLENYQLAFCGGVAANQYLREKIINLCRAVNFKLFCPPPKLCTDNAVMIAWAGYELFKLKGQGDDLSFKPRARWAL